MKTSLFSIVLVGVVSVCFVAPADAATGRKRDRAPGGRMMNRFDQNKDGKIEGTEAERLRAMFSRFAALDTDRDGKLSDPEVAAIKVPPPRQRKKQ